MDPRTEAVIERFVEETKSAFGADLVSVVLYGSAAEDALRPTSDVNVIVVTKRFDAAAAERLRGGLGIAAAAIRLRAMFIAEGEIPDAAAAFAVKFDDVVRRHRVLFGSDPFASLEVPRAAAIARLRQVCLNLLLRLRNAWVLEGDPEERLGAFAADAAGPLRACAAELLALEGRPEASPREALRRVVGDPLEDLSKVRAGQTPAPGATKALMLRLIAAAEALRERAGRLS
jgi:predicted nucleotidyltransferase